MPRATPMFHVPDVAVTARWYETIGFVVSDRGEDDGMVVWAALTFGESEIMLNIGGKASDAHRREVDLYVTVDDVDAHFAKIGANVELIKPLHDTYYGMREFIIRDHNRFWITFGTPVAKR